MSATSTKKEYFEAVGRRKTSTARVRITPSTKDFFTVNDKEMKDYFKTATLQNVVTEAFATAKGKKHFSVTVMVNGGGTSSQAGAVRHGVARTLLLWDAEETKADLKKAGFLKRDPRAKERRKFGLKKARKAPQWSKR